MVPLHPRQSSTHERDTAINTLTAQVHLDLLETRRHKPTALDVLMQGLTDRRRQSSRYLGRLAEQSLVFVRHVHVSSRHEHNYAHIILDWSRPPGTEPVSC
ncbi:hypothetical protein PA08_2195 [Cutibacterium modestum P08]|nr:hypothetical protein PA08_2195 [Cutibacterium modestum P08]